MVCIRSFKSKGKTYYGVVKTFRQDGRVKQEVLQYIGSQEKLTEFLLNKANVAEFFSADLENLLYQTPVSLWKLMEQMQLQAIFRRHFSKEWGVDAATAACVMILNYATDRRSKCRINDWYSQTYLPHLLKVPPSKMNKDLLCRTMDFFTEDKIEEIHAEVFRSANEKYKFSGGLLFYDLTTVTFEGDHCPMAKKGYNPEAVDRLQVNIGLAVTPERFPIMHKVFEGNTKDVKTMEKVMGLLKKTTSLHSVVFIFDRGITSKNNIQMILAEGAGYICGVSKSKTVKDLILSLDDTSFTKIDDVSSFYETTKDGQRIIIFRNSEMIETQRTERQRRLEKIEKKLDKLKKNASRYKRARLHEKIGEITRNYRRYFRISTKGGLSFSRKEEALKIAELLDGKCAIITNTSLPPSEILRRYRDRNFIEMSFRELKMFVDIRPVRHWKDRRVLAHVFLAVLAFGLRSIVEMKIRRAGLQLTAEEALLRLNKVRALVAKEKVLRLTGETDEIRRIAVAVEG